MIELEVNGNYTIKEAEEIVKKIQGMIEKEKPIFNRGDKVLVGSGKTPGTIGSFYNPQKLNCEFIVFNDFSCGYWDKSNLKKI